MPNPKLIKGALSHSSNSIDLKPAENRKMR